MYVVPSTDQDYVRASIRTWAVLRPALLQPLLDMHQLVLLMHARTCCHEGSYDAMPNSHAFEGFSLSRRE